MEQYQSIQILQRFREESFKRGLDCNNVCIKCKKIILNVNKNSNVIGWFPCGSKKIKGGINERAEMQ